MTPPPPRPPSSGADLGDHVADLLARSAAAVAVHPDLDAVTGADADAVVVRLHDAPARTRRRLALAGAAALLVVVAAVALVVTRDTTHTVDLADGRPAARYPVLDGLPAGVDGPVLAEDVGPGPDEGAAPAATGLFRSDVPLVSTVVARSSGLLGDWEDAVVVEAYGSRLPDQEAYAPVTLAGVDALVADEGATVIVSGEATIVATGGAGAVATTTDLLAAGMAAGLDARGLPTLAIDREAAARADLEVLWPPQELRAGPGATLTVGPGDPAEATVTTGGELADTGLARRFGWWEQVSIAEGQGGSAAEADGVAEVAWTDDADPAVRWQDRTVVRVRVRGTIDDALALAAHVRLVDEAEWRRTYEVATAEEGEGAPTDPTPTTTATTAGPSAGATDTTQAEGASPTVPPPPGAVPPARLPVLGAVPERFARTDDLRQAHLRAPSEPAARGEVAVVAGTDDGDLRDAVLVEAWAATPLHANVFAGAEATTPLTVGGRSAVVGHRGPTPVDGEVLQLGIAGTPALLLSGMDQGRLEEVAAQVDARLDADGTARLDLSGVPADELVEGPRAVPVEVQVLVAAPGSGSEVVWVETTELPPAAVLAPYSAVERGEVGGEVAWLADHEGGADVAWEDEGVTVHVRGSLTREELLAVAADVTLVDETTWRATYPVLMDTTGGR